MRGASPRALFFNSPTATWDVGANTYLDESVIMDLGFSGFVFLIPIAAWAISFYLFLRFLRVFERAVDAHERIADALVRQGSLPRPRVDER